MRWTGLRVIKLECKDISMEGGLELVALLMRWWAS